MSIVQMPLGRGRGELERTALRRGLASAARVGLLEVVLVGPAGATVFCAGCAGPIEFGPIARFGQVYCSIECSLGGDHSA